MITSKADRQKEIQALGAKAAIGSLKYIDFLTKTSTGTDVAYLMEPTEPNRLLDQTFNPYERVSGLVNIYKNAIKQTGVRKIVYLLYRRAYRPGNGFIAISNSNMASVHAFH